MGRGGQIALVLGVMGVGIALGGGVVYLALHRPAAPSLTPPPPPPSVAAAPEPVPDTEPTPEPSPEAAPSSEAAPASPAPGAATAARPRPVRPPAKGATPTRPAPPVAVAPPTGAAPRPFVLGVPVATGPLVRGDVPGFEGARGEVHRAARIPGTVEFETAPAAPVPGQPYAVRVFLTNTGKKDIKLLSVVVTAAQDGLHSGGLAPVAVKEIKPGQRVLLAERTETWPAKPPRSWELQATIKSKDDDTYFRTLTWK